MKVTQVAIRPTEESNRKNRPALTPELLAASGARYSRNNEGLEAILAKIDPDNLDKSVDSIFKMIDYGHQSIADMVPVAMFIDGVSLFLAYYIWSVCPTASGQESSTRYINYGSETLISADDLGIPNALRDEWNANTQDCLRAYQEALQEWENLAASDGELARIPRSLLQDESDKAQKQVARMKRNYGFDRARNFLPSCLPTNVMMLMSARAWTQLCQHLRSHPLYEAQTLGEKIAGELNLAAPRMTRHAVRQDSIVAGLEREHQKCVALAQSESPFLQPNSTSFACPPRAHLDVQLPAGVAESDLVSDLEFHHHRYAWIGENLKRSVVRFGWDAVALAEIRDLNRHRTGTKHCPLVPQGFYAALEEWPEKVRPKNGVLFELAQAGRSASRRARELLRNDESAYVYWTALGTQFPFEHVTTAEKFIYEAELRTGTGAHFRYAQHLRDVLKLWYDRFPTTRDLILEGSAEPE